MSKYFDDNHIRQILQATSIVDVIGTYVALKSRGREFLGLCPFHDDRRPSLNVSAVKQIFKCFACGAGGDVIKFIMLRERMSFPEAVQLLADRAGIKLPERHTERQQEYDRNELEAVNRWAARFFRDQFEAESEGRRPRDYVFGRGITPEIARQFGLGWAPASWDTLIAAAEQADQPPGRLAHLGLVVKKEQGGYYDRFRERLIFPVIDALGRVIGFGGRTLGDDSAKYLNSPESELFDKSRAVYGIHAAKDAIVRARTAVVVEGYTDCIMAHQFGITNAVATLGTALTTDHARVLSRYADRIVLVFDSDDAGRKASDRSIEIFFSQQIEVKLVSLPKGMDPCDFLLAEGRDAFDELIAGATEALEYKWQAMQVQLDAAETVSGRKRAVDEFLTAVAQAFTHGNVDAIAKGFVLNHVAKLVEQPSEQVHAQVGLLERRFRRMATPSATSLTPSPTTDSYTNAQRDILEVLLNRPELFEQVQEVIPDANEFEDPVLGPIARRIWDYCTGDGQAGLAEVLAGVESVELSKVMTDMAQRGSDRGNFESTLAGALGNIRHVRRENARQDIRKMVGNAGDEFGADAEAAMLLDFQSRCQQDARRTGAR